MVKPRGCLYYFLPLLIIGFKDIPRPVTVCLPFKIVRFSLHSGIQFVSFSRRSYAEEGRS